MVVYMALNTVTEMSYVGATRHSFDERWKSHLKEARLGSNTRFHVAIREWPEEFWTLVVLANCYDEEELSSAERLWMLATDCLNPIIGYNDCTTPYSVSVANGRLGNLNVKKLTSTSVFNQLSSEEKKKFFRECGIRGAKVSKEIRLASLSSTSSPQPTSNE